MAYNQNIPAATDLLSISQGDIQANFQSLYATILANHASFSPNADFGKHTMVQLVPRAAALAGNPGFWANSGSANDIMIRNNAGNDINITTRGFTLNTNGYTYLPSGLLLKFGMATTALAGGIYTKTVNMDAIAAHYSQRPFLQITPLADISGSGTLNRLALLRPDYTSAQFTIQSYDGTGHTEVATFSWLAIGTV